MLFLLVLFLILFLVFLYTYEQLKKARFDTLVLDYRYRLFALRDELRDHAIKGDFNKNSWVFDYLDTSITKSIKLLSLISIWVISYDLTIMMIREIFGKNDNLNKAIHMLSVELKKEENSTLRQLYYKFDDILGSFLQQRHIHLSYVVMALYEMIKLRPKAKQVAKRLRKFWKKILRKTTESPKFSTLTEMYAQ